MSLTLNNKGNSTMKMRPSADDRRIYSIPIRFNEDEREILELAASIKGMKLSHFVANYALIAACDIASGYTEKLYTDILKRVTPLLIKESKKT